mmetsp:Transcript_140732/g.245155  ORF Transcript_140732/g.245155 Transcript_140732/m.245155 type:complete len:85 (+) Transcript_140732:415-669(+)
MTVCQRNHVAKNGRLMQSGPHPRKWRKEVARVLSSAKVWEVLRLVKEKVVRAVKAEKVEAEAELEVLLPQSTLEVYLTRGTKAS